MRKKHLLRYTDTIAIDKLDDRWRARSDLGVIVYGETAGDAEQKLESAVEMLFEHLKLTVVVGLSSRD
ncbi:MAG: hypothetical protein GEU28_00910 [Dehalococcoidia bacterium]|nr:hypothetical protein [Dehalococcoidia bacterium]